MGRRPADVRSSRSTKEGEGMWRRLALVVAIMPPHRPPYITQMSDFSKVFCSGFRKTYDLKPSYCRWAGASIE
jgi:hypothetical protein